MVERVDGTVPGRGGVLHDSLHPHPDGRLGHGLLVPVLLLDDHAVGLQLEVGTIATERPLHQELERRLGALEVESLVLERLELLEDPARVRRVLVDVDPVLPRLPQDVGLAGQLGHEDAAVVADSLRVDVLVRLRVLEDRGHVHAALVREGRVADVGLRRPRRAVGQLRDETGDVAQLAEVRLGDAVEPHLEDQARDDRHEVGVAAALAEAVERPLHLADALGDRGQRVRHRALGVVVHVDPERRPHVLLHGLQNRHQLGRQCAAVRVAQHEPLGARVLRGLQRGQRVLAVGAEAVEEVLGVEQHLVHPGPEERERVTDHREVLGQRGAERLGHVEVPRLADDRGHRRARLQERLHVGVRIGVAAGAAGHAEGRELRVLERDVLHPPEEPQIFWIGARPTALDVVDAERVQTGGEPDFVLHRERHTLALGAVSQRRVVDLDQPSHRVPPIMLPPLAGCQ